MMNLNGSNLTTTNLTLANKNNNNNNYNMEYNNGSTTNNNNNNNTTNNYDEYHLYNKWYGDDISSAIQTNENIIQPNNSDSGSSSCLEPDLFKNNLWDFKSSMRNENCSIHGMPNKLWCITCNTLLCRACYNTTTNGDMEQSRNGHADTEDDDDFDDGYRRPNGQTTANNASKHQHHNVKIQSIDNYQKEIEKELQEMEFKLAEVHRLKSLKRDILQEILENCLQLKRQLDNDMEKEQNAGKEVEEMLEHFGNLKLSLEILQYDTTTVNEAVKLYTVVRKEKEGFVSNHKYLIDQFRIYEFIKTNKSLQDFGRLKQLIKHQIERREGMMRDEGGGGEVMREFELPFQLITNYCIVQTFKSCWRQQQQQQLNDQQQQIFAEMKFQMQQLHLNVSNENRGGANHVLPSNVPPPGFSLSNSSTNEFSRLVTNWIPKTCSSSTISSTGETSSISTPTNRRICNGGNQPNLTSNIISSTNNQQQQQQQQMAVQQLLLNPISNFNKNIYYIDFFKKSNFFGRIFIKLFINKAPKMSYNFHCLATGTKGYGYSGSRVFECHPNESIITGDIPGHGSRSAFDEEPQFVPDDTSIPPFRGAVGMRRGKIKHDSKGLVGSQFRIILTDLYIFSAIFGHVVEGLYVVEEISKTLLGENAIYIGNCGLYEFVKRDITDGI